MRTALALVLLPLLLPAAASAGLVAAGETTTLSSYDLGTPAGTLVDQKSTPFTLNYGVADPANGFDGTISGTFKSSVYRSAGGTLSFLYDVDLNPVGVGGAAEGSTLSARSFAGRTTNVAGALDFESLFAASRSVDGATVQVASDTPGLGGSPTMWVETDATTYNDAGTAAYRAGDEVLGNLVSDEATINGVFAPAPSAPPAAIPLPPAAYTGLGVLLGMVLIAGTKRVWAHGV